ncbi:AcrR family transcriptional regulator [Nakamurella sp. UYEF19]|uniref:TetR/AcrR family transcriptional regulator n=1 Tax=Nakamurella sp. UYEF19 TaxID=1756392 RepID=UPI003394DA18
MAAPVQRRRTAKERLLRAADELFYAEGIHAVGIERVLERAGVARGSLYYSFKGKDELVQAYLTRRHSLWVERVSAGISDTNDPRERILAVFDVLATLFSEPDYRGCAFMNATAEAVPGSVEVQVAKIFRGWIHELFLQLATDTRTPHPAELANTLVILYDGAVANAQMDKNPDAANIAKSTANLVMDSVKAQPPTPTEVHSGELTAG